MIWYISGAWRHRSRIIVIDKRGCSRGESGIVEVLLVVIWQRRRLATRCRHQLRERRSIVVRRWQWLRRMVAIHRLR
jgi:hypothetical protein